MFVAEEAHVASDTRIGRQFRGAAEVHLNRHCPSKQRIHCRGRQGRMNRGIAVA